MSRNSEQFVEELKQIHPTIEVKGSYVRAIERVLVKCTVCGKEWNPKAYSLLQGKGCPHCSAIRGAKSSNGKTKLKSHEVFISQLSEVNNDIIVCGKYINTHTNVTCKCIVCGYLWNARPYSLLQGHGCPRCAKSGTSFAEQLIYLTLSHVLGEDEVLSRDKTVIGMELDIVIPRFKIAIEPGNWNLHKKSLNRDRKKREKCKEIGYRLITIYDLYPQNEPPPFFSDCFVFAKDLNSEKHEKLHELIGILLSLMEIKIDKLCINWCVLEKQAYTNSKAKTHIDFVNELKTVNSEIEVVGKYVNSNMRMTVKCTKCGHTWEAIPSSLLTGDGCRKCGTIKAHQSSMKTHSDFVSELSLINSEVEIIGQYKGRHAPIHARCKICGFEWFPQAGSLLRGSNHKGSKGIHKTNKNKANNMVFEKEHEKI